VAAVYSIFDELLPAILSHVEDADVQQTILAVSRVFPAIYIPPQRFLARIILTRPKQCVYLHRRLRGPHPDAVHVKELRIQTWTVDAEVVANLLDVLDDVKVLALYVGANFVPEVLQRIMEKTRDGLQTLLIRFRP
jgi:hypothetical protein